MSLTTTPDPANITAVTGEAIADTDQLGRADIKKKKGMSAGAHAALWIVIGYLLAICIIAAWPLALLLINGGDGNINGY